MTSNNFTALERAAFVATLSCRQPHISTRTHGCGVPVNGYVTWRRVVASLLVDVHPRNHDLYRTKVNGKQYTIARNAPVDKIAEWLKKLNSL